MTGRYVALSLTGTSLCPGEYRLLPGGSARVCCARCGELVQVPERGIADLPALPRHGCAPAGDFAGNRPAPVAGVPQAPGSVVTATLTHQGKTGRRVLLRRVPFDGEPPWVSEQDVCDRAYWHDADLTDPAVLHLP